MNETQETHDADERSLGVLAEDWSKLRGRTIEVHYHGERVDHGKVDTVSPDGNLLWLSFEGVSPRRLVEKLPLTCVLILPD